MLHLVPPSFTSYTVLTYTDFCLTYLSCVFSSKFVPHKGLPHSFTSPGSPQTNSAFISHVFTRGFCLTVLSQDTVLPHMVFPDDDLPLSFTSDTVLPHVKFVPKIFTSRNCTSYNSTTQIHLLQFTFNNFTSTDFQGSIEEKSVPRTSKREIITWIVGKM